MKVKTAKDKYLEITENLNYFEGNKKFILLPNKKGLEVFISSIKKPLILDTKNLKLLDNSDGVQNIKDFEYILSCGYRYLNFFEIVININPSNIYFFDQKNDWHAKPLLFRLDTNQIEIGPVSPLFVLLYERKFYNEFEDYKTFASIKLVVNNGNRFNDEVIKVLYYLNSHYLKKIGMTVNVKLLKDDDYYDPSEDDTDYFKSTTRKRNIKRKDFINTVPLSLFNYAIESNGDQKFIFFYRIFEFFWNKAKLLKLKEMRYNNNVSEKKIAEILDIRNETKSLQMLLSEAISEKKKNKLSSYAKFNKMIKNNNFENLVDELYKFRNSIVHAKEEQLSKTNIPNPFLPNQEIIKWIYIAEELSLECIKKYNIRK